MIHPLPPGTRDVLPDEMRELRALSERLRASFDAAGYGEVYTPSVEYEDTLRRGDERAARAGVYRLFDEQGRVLVMRSDTTLSIARLVATRYGGVRPPVRLCYFAHAYRTVERGRGQAREFLQGGVELIGPEAPEGEAEVLSLVVGGLSEAGLRRHRVGLGDGSLVRELLAELEVAPARRGDLLEHLSRRDLVALEMEAKALGLSQAACELLVTLPSLRGGPEVLDRAHGPVGRAVEGLRALFELLAERGVADRVILDLGLVRELGYYTGAVYEVYDPAVGYALGGGGRYDDLLGRFGTPLPACGLALDIGRVHAAQAAEERLG
ncbi:MAG TPA: ATP phosphoribosyltransferase regulatory subunit [Thermoleophilaceae bacterium]|jgi:ATP phosphoribosyltransferase regulatory subunit|nr:ATP phosphoribosyltransferase regulatory subunit [Thermoleophilaceae bacterium]